MIRVKKKKQLTMWYWHIMVVSSAVLRVPIHTCAVQTFPALNLKKKSIVEVSGSARCADLNQLFKKSIKRIWTSKNVAHLGFYAIYQHKVAHNCEELDAWLSNSTLKWKSKSSKNKKCYLVGAVLDLNGGRSRLDVSNQEVCWDALHKGN